MNDPVPPLREHLRILIRDDQAFERWLMEHGHDGWVGIPGSSQNGPLANWLGQAQQLDAVVAVTTTVIYIPGMNWSEKCPRWMEMFETTLAMQTPESGIERGRLMTAEQALKVLRASRRVR